MTTLIVNFDEPRERQLLAERLRCLRGQHKFEIKKWRASRTHPQNAFYWAAITTEFARYLKDSDPEADEDTAHWILREKFLKRQIVDEQTGQIFTFVISTTSLSIDEMSAYIEACIAFLAELGVTVDTSLCKTWQNKNKTATGETPCKTQSS